MLLYGGYMSDARLKWRCLFFLSILSCFDLKAKNERSNFFFQLQTQLSKFHTRDINANTEFFMSSKVNHDLQNVLQKSFSLTNKNFSQILK